MEGHKVIEDCITNTSQHKTCTVPGPPALQHGEETHEVPPLTGKLYVLSAVVPDRLPTFQQVSLELYTFSQLDSVG